MVCFIEAGKQGAFALWSVGVHKLTYIVCTCRTEGVRWAVLRVLGCSLRAVEPCWTWEAIL